jgi:hypothetical protein
MAAIGRPATSALPQTLRLPLSGRAAIVAGLVVLGLLGLLPLLESSHATTAGFTVGELEAQRDGLRAEVSNLETEVAGYAALDYVEGEATTRLGMVPPTQRLFVSVDEPAPRLDSVPWRYRPQAVAEDGDSSPWWQELAGFLNLD